MTPTAPQQIRVYAKIVGDLLHPGHVRFFAAARALGTHLTVCVVPDERVMVIKRRPIMTTAERLEVVAACRCVDQVIADGPKIITPDFMHRYGYALYAFGARDEAEHRGKLADCADLPAHMRRRVDYSPDISTTEIIQRIEHRLRAADAG